VKLQQEGSSPKRLMVIVTVRPPASITPRSTTPAFRSRVSKFQRTICGQPVEVDSLATSLNAGLQLCSNPLRGRKVTELPLLSPAALVMALALLVWRLWRVETVRFNPDEFWHLHSAWCLSRGAIPYRDFFEHHTPWLYFLLAPVLSFYRVEVDPNAAVAFIFLARRIMIFLAAVALALTFALGWMWRGERVAWVSVVLLSSAVVFAQKTLEVRPDVPALVLWLAGLVTLLRATESGIGSRTQRWRFTLSGLLLSGAILTAQKMVVVIPGFGLAMLWYLLTGQGAGGKRLLNCLHQAAGFIAPIIATSAFFWMHHALWPFIKYSLINTEWKTRHAPHLLTHVIAQNPILVVLACLGLVREAFYARTSTANAMLFLITVGAISGVFALPTPWLQNYLIFLPLLSLYAGSFLLFIADCISRTEFAFSRPGQRLAAAVAFGLGAAGVITLLSEPVSPYVHALFAILLLAGIVLLLRLPEAALVCLLLAFSVHPAYEIHKELSSSNAVQIQKLRYVLANTLPTDTVMDGWSGLGVFRPSAWFYPFVHGEIVPLLSADDGDQLWRGLQSGQIAPKFVFPNEAMLSISSQVAIFLLSHYEPVGGDPYLRQRR
jgi:hypothetical protein